MSMRNAKQDAERQRVIKAICYFNNHIQQQLRFEKCLRPELLFVWDIDLQKRWGRKCWDIPRLQFEKSWDIPKIGEPKKMGYPKF